MIELHHALGSTCSQRVRMALAEKALSWISRPIDFAKEEQLSARYLAINPNGLVPTLIHAGQAIADSSVIMEYLEDVFPERPLRPITALARARMREWCAYLDEVATPATRVPSFHYLFSTNLRAMDAQQRWRYAERRPLRRAFYHRIGAEGFQPDELEEAQRQLRETLLRAEAVLTRQPYLVDDALSLADLSLLPTMMRLQDLRMQALWSDCSGVQAWMARLIARPSFASAYPPGSRTLRCD